MKIIGVVPARLAASRFPGKPLLPICGRPSLRFDENPSSSARITCPTMWDQFISTAFALAVKPQKRPNFLNND